MTKPPQRHDILMLVHDRPIYLYMTLDSLQRATLSPYRLTVFHHLSGDPLVSQVLQGFLARGVIDQIIEIPDETVAYVKLFRMASARGLRDGEVFFWLEDDVVIEADSRCWIAKMLAAFGADDRLAMAGSAIDKSDFIDPGALQAVLGRDLTAAELTVIKAASPERHQEFENGEMVGRTHGVAGRFMGLRSAAITEDVINLDYLMNRALHAAGWTTRVLPDVRHRHMSLQNYYDYPDYMVRRDRHMNRNQR